MKKYRYTINRSDGSVFRHRYRVEEYTGIGWMYCTSRLCIFKSSAIRAAKRDIDRRLKKRDESETVEYP